jgi:hypothetical protein
VWGLSGSKRRAPTSLSTLQTRGADSLGTGLNVCLRYGPGVFPMSQARDKESGVRIRISTLSATALVKTCHDLLDTASSLSMNVEFLANADMGSSADREAAVADARISVMKLTETLRGLQDAAREAAARAA